MATGTVARHNGRLHFTINTTVAARAIRRISTAYAISAHHLLHQCRITSRLLHSDPEL